MMNSAASVCSAKQLNIPNLYTCEEILKEAVKRSEGMQALEYRRGAKKFVID
jgi:hypothetical protein